LHAPLRGEEDVLAKPLKARLVAWDELEREVEAAGAHELDERLDARRHGALLVPCNHGPLPAASLSKLVLRESGAEPGLADQAGASHAGECSARDLIQPRDADMLHDLVKRRTGVGGDQLTFADWERTLNEDRKREVEVRHDPERAHEEVAELADALVPRLVEELAARTSAGGTDLTTAPLLTLDQLVAVLPKAKRPETWKRWLYERTRRGEVPGCVKLGGMLFFEREPALAWLRAGAVTR
jgi:hypothetical protein